MIDFTSLQPATLGILVFALLIAVRVGVFWFLASAGAALAAAHNYETVGAKLAQLSQTVVVDVVRLISQ